MSQSRLDSFGPALQINAMTPGYILTDITRGMGATKPPEEGTKAAIH